jgi:hypothetical protein
VSLYHMSIENKESGIENNKYEVDVDILREFKE